jgi:protein-arginine kinase activator protein McsA
MKDFIQAIGKCLKKEITQEELRRALICKDCPSKAKRKYASMLNSAIKEVNGFVCDECSCPLATKLFATEEKHICKKWKT